MDCGNFLLVNACASGALKCFTDADLLIDKAPISSSSRAGLSHWRFHPGRTNLPKRKHESISPTMAKELTTCCVIGLGKVYHSRNSA